MSYKTLGLGRAAVLFFLLSFFFFIIYEAQLLARFRHLDSSKILPFHARRWHLFIGLSGRKKKTVTADEG